MTESKQSSERPESIDVAHVTCGLVPLMQTHLGGTPPEVESVEFRVRQGIEVELWNAFGTGRQWRLVEIRNDLFTDVARFVRVEQDDLDPLGLLEF
ncbi:hypothetical protein [Pseudodesulfovibrio alkaliphilus]|nr:hypothetical protein [Pseudodesulfovibrio alkaliphilus]